VGERQKYIVVLILIFMLVQVSSADDLEPPLKVTWKTRIGPPGFGSIDLIISDVIYSNNYELQAINANNGKLLWSGKRCSSFAYYDGVLYATRPSTAPNLYALDFKTGKEIWLKEYPEIEEFDYEEEQKVVISDGMIFLIGDHTKAYPPSQTEITDDPSSFLPEFQYAFGILALDTRGNVKWHKTYNKSLITDTLTNTLAISPNVMVVRTHLNDIYDFTAINLTSGEILWEITDIEGEPRVYEGIFLIEKGRMLNKNGVYIIAVSKSNGEILWEKRVGDSNGEIITFKDNKLFVLAEDIKILNSENGEILDDYTIPLDPFSLEYSSNAVSDQTLYIMPHQTHESSGISDIYAFGLDTGELLWKEKIKGVDLFFYKNKIYTTQLGNLYAYEHGVDVSRFIYFGIFVTIVIIANLFSRFNKHNTRLQHSLLFSTLLTLVAYFWFLMRGLPSVFIYLGFLIPSLDTNWVFYLLFPGISVITGAIIGMRKKNKFLIGMITGIMPFLIATGVTIISYLVQDMNLIFFFLHEFAIFIFSLLTILILGLAFGVVGSLLNFILGIIKLGNEKIDM
jgi:outer membrane protein assembly factor BamB